MKIYFIEEIKHTISFTQDLAKLLDSQRQAFIDYSKGLIYVPQPLQMTFTNPSGDCHIKAGVRAKDELFVVKIATGFYNNTNQGLPSIDGAFLLFSTKTGLLEAILCDGGYLTLLRTALAAGVAAQTTPFPINKIGIVGTGGLANLILQVLRLLFPSVAIQVWGRNFVKAKSLVVDDPRISTTNSISELLQNSNLVITATASTKPIIHAKNISDNVHIIALGADEPGKQELDVSVFKMADQVIVDSKEQALRFGDSFHAMNAGIINSEKLEELGKILITNSITTSQTTIMITDLSGIAAQDIAISSYVLNKIMIGKLKNTKL